MFLYEKYYPITATPFLKNEQYMEYAPCDALKPYIRCFWGTSKPIRAQKTNIPTFDLVTPDTCVDVIFEIDYTKNKIYDVFCGIDDVMFQSHSANDNDHIVSTFAVRFYAWSAVLFSEESMKGTKNQFYDVGVHFEKLKKELGPKLFDIRTIEERSALAEDYLLKHFYVNHENSLFQRAMAKIIENQGNMKALELATDLHISSKQIERVFHENIGATPKKIATLVRYQSLWQDVCFNPSFLVLDAVHKYGYTDQAHLLNVFRKFHGLSLSDARRYAWKDDEFLQENFVERGYIVRENGQVF